MPGQTAALLWVRQPSTLLLGGPRWGAQRELGPWLNPCSANSQATGAQASTLATLTLFPPPQIEGLTTLLGARVSSEPQRRGPAHSRYVLPTECRCCAWISGAH